MLPQFTQFPDLHRSHYLHSTNFSFVSCTSLLESDWVPTYAFGKPQQLNHIFSRHPPLSFTCHLIYISMLTFALSLEVISIHFALI